VRSWFLAVSDGVAIVTRNACTGQSTSWTSRSILVASFCLTDRHFTSWPRRGDAGAVADLREEGAV